MTARLNVDFPSEDYIYLKMICAKKGVSIKDFVVPLVLRAIEEEEDSLLVKKAQHRLKNIDQADLISIEDAFNEAGWNA